MQNAHYLLQIIRAIVVSARLIILLCMKLTIVVISQYVKTVIILAGYPNALISKLTVKNVSI